MQEARERVAHMRAGTPSMIAPTPLQCDSPKVVTRKIVPKVDMPLGDGRERRRRGTELQHDDLLTKDHKERRPTIITPWELAEACCLCCSCCGAITSTEPLAAIVLTAACEGSR